MVLSHDSALSHDPPVVEPGPQEAAPAPEPIGARPRWWGPAAGLTAAAAALGVGQLVSGFDASFKPPVVSVGDRVIDVVPGWVKDFAIDTFGTNDKPALITGTVVILAVVAVLAGIAALGRRLLVGLGLVAGFTAMGMIAATTGRDGHATGWVPSLAAGLAAAGALGLFRRATRMAAPTGPDTSTGPGAPARTAAGTTMARRGFLVALGAVAVGAAALGAGGQGLRRRFSADLERAIVRIRRPAKPLAPPPTDPAATIEGLTPLIVANRDFYRIDTALITPSVSIDNWQLRIDGMVGRPITLSYDELWNRELVEVDVTLSCVSNEVGGGLVGNARWVGVRLNSLLAEAEIDADADQIMSHSVDGFTAGFPTDTVTDGRNAIIALTMNGEVLPVAHGYPARLVVPGLYGYVSATKWLSRLEMTRFDRAQGYWVPRGWSALGPIKTQSRIDVPRAGATRSRSELPEGELVVAGVAWAPGPGIDRGEVQVDEGPWLAAELGPELSQTSWRQWWLAWPAQPGAHTLRCRATDGNGVTQTAERADPAPDGASGWHRVEVTIKR